jgi:hypothetical protein
MTIITPRGPAEVLFPVAEGSISARCQIGCVNTLNSIYVPDIRRSGMPWVQGPIG